MSLRARLGRLIYIFGKPVITIVFRYGRPRTRVFVVARGELLLVQSVIGSGAWELPGGGLRLKEAPIDGARRELREELGLKIDASMGQLLSAAPLRITHQGSRFRCWPILVMLSQQPELRLRRTEILATQWVPVSGLLRTSKLDDSVRQLASFLKDEEILLK